ncbi:MAG TPA: prolipoprotein diacylglyceryl transferase [Longimicrobiales bacterium]|nr:prolipoprotein diacylglyceryl transferase [Longimicrobiales bacterium]
MYPVIFTIGDFPITSFGLFMFLSFIVGAWATGVQLQRYGMPKELAWDVLAWVALGGILGAKLYYLALNYDALIVNPVGELLSRGGLVWYGGLIGGVVAYYIQIRSRKLPLATMYDATAPTLALSYAVGRMGCFFVGDDYGRYTASAVGIAFPEGSPPSTAGMLRTNGDVVPAAIPDSAVVPVHPTQLYEVGLALIMFAILWHLGKKRGFRAGQLFAVYLAMYGVERFLIEIVRTKSDRMLLGMSTSQIASILLLGVAAYIWQRQKTRGAPTPLVSAQPPSTKRAHAPA